MKTLIKYIALLIFSGVIIPLYLSACAVKPVPVNNAPLVGQTVDGQPHNGGFHLYFISEIVAKLLPIADFLK